MPFVLDSTAFVDNGAIPAKYTCDGENLSPPLRWSGAPTGAKSFVLVVEDPDAPAGVFRHWAVYNISADRSALPEGAGSGNKAASLSHGINDFGHARYDGPCPPRGHGTHHYHFRLAAIDSASLSLSARPRVAEVWKAAEGHLLGRAEMVGTYRR